MLDLKYVRMIEKTGVSNKYGKRIHGTAALLHYLQLMERHVNDIAPETVLSGKEFVNKFFHTL